MDPVPSTSHNTPTTKEVKPSVAKKRKNIKKKNEDTINLRADLERHEESLAKLMNLPEKVDKLINLMSVPGEINSEETGDSLHSEVNDDEADTPIDLLLQKTNESNSGEVDDPQSLKDILNITQPINEYGPALHSDVAEALKRLYVPDNAKKLVDKVKDNYKIPENCTYMGVPKVNNEIWPLLPQRSKQKDLSYQQQQLTLATSASAMARVAEIIFSTKKLMDNELRQDLLKKTMEACAALALLHDDVNKKRKNEMKSLLDSDVAGICSSSITQDGLLFGSNVSEQLKTMRATSKVVNSSVRGSQHRQRQYRFSPYARPYLNYQSPSQRGRGTNSRFQRGRPWRTGASYRGKFNPIGNQYQNQSQK